APTRAAASCAAATATAGATQGTAGRREAPTRGPRSPLPPLIRAGFFVTVGIIDTCEFLGTFRPFMLQTTVGSLRQDQLFFQAPVLAQTLDGWPGFWDKASLGPGVMPAQRPSQGGATTTNDAQPPAP